MGNKKEYKMDYLEMKRLNELIKEIKLCGEIYKDKNWENYDEYNRLWKMFQKTFNIKNEIIIK